VLNRDRIAQVDLMKHGPLRDVLPQPCGQIVEHRDFMPALEVRIDNV
jgi:hypothetical protein